MGMFKQMVVMAFEYEEGLELGDFWNGGQVSRIRLDLGTMEVTWPSDFFFVDGVSVG